MSGAGLTSRQRATLQFLRSYHDANGIFPTFDEIRIALGLASKSGVHRLITGLEERGHIRRIRFRARAFDFCDLTQIDTADALRVVLSRCKMTAATARDLNTLLQAEVGA